MAPMTWTRCHPLRAVNAAQGDSWGCAWGNRRVIVRAAASYRPVGNATRADTTGSMTDAIVVSASTVSLDGVGYLLVAESAKGGEVYGAAAVGIGSIVVSWFAIHTVFTLRYAQLYYSGAPGGIDFNQPEPPAYVDFAYLAFTIGMAFQVSDTDLQTRKIRATALRHSLLSYLFGVVIVAMTINLIIELSHSIR